MIGLKGEGEGGGGEMGENAAIVVEEGDDGSMQQTTASDEAVVDDRELRGVGQRGDTENLAEVRKSSLSPEEIKINFTELNETFGKRVVVFSKQLEELQQSMDESGVAGKEQYDSLKKSIEAELETVEELLESSLTTENQNEMQPQLLEIKKTLQTYKIEAAKSLLPSDLLEASSMEGVVEALTKMKLGDFEEREAFVEKLRLILSGDVDLEQLLGEDEDPDLSKIKKIANGFKKYGYLAEMAINVFFDKDMGDLGAFISFILNPTGSSSGGYEYKHTGENGEVIPYYVFKEKFRNHSLVGRSMSEFAKKHADDLGLSAWRDDQKDNLYSIGESSDIIKTHGVLSSFYDVALRDDAIGYEEKWDVFKKEFTSEMFGGKEVSMDEESVEFLKELLKNEAEELKKFWKMDAGDSDKKTAEPEERKSGTEQLKEEGEALSDAPESVLGSPEEAVIKS